MACGSIGHQPFHIWDIPKEGANAFQVAREWLVGETNGRAEAFLADFLALVGEDVDAIRQDVGGAIADCGQIFGAREVNKRTTKKAAHASRR
jgi:hypothetical protein